MGGEKNMSEEEQKKEEINEIIEKVENKAKQEDNTAVFSDSAIAVIEEDTINGMAEKIYNDVINKIESLPARLDTNKDGKVSHKEFWTAFGKYALKLLILVITWTTVFIGIAGIFALKEIATLEQMMKTGEWSWDFIYGNILSAAISTVVTYITEKKKIANSKIEAQIREANRNKDLAELREIAKQHTHEEEILTLKAKHEIELMGKDLKGTQDEIQIAVKNACARIAIEKQLILEAKIAELEKEQI